MIRRTVDASILLVVAANGLHLTIALLRYVNAIRSKMADPFAEALDGLVG